MTADRLTSTQEKPFEFVDYYEVFGFIHLPHHCGGVLSHFSLQLLHSIDVCGHLFMLSFLMVQHLNQVDVWTLTEPL